jgi:NAD(P)-dependent dehydrogenase (short-subunit alcohol dehydrogenase family)
VDFGLKDATAVVVGGGRGMGLAAARCLADDGARVALVGRNRAVLDSATADLNLSLRGSPDAVALVADTEDEQQVQRVYALMAAIDTHFGHPAHEPRTGLPDEIGSVVAFLASRRNSNMTGANINVDGGSDFN